MLGVGAALYLQMHVRCKLALVAKVYTTNAPPTWASVLPPRCARAPRTRTDTRGIYIIRRVCRARRVVATALC